MSVFACPVARVSIESHPNADKLELARIGDFRAIVQKGAHRDGELAVYIPEAAILPERTLRQLGLWKEESGKGILGGGAGDRVKAIRLRGVVSQGLVFPLSERDAIGVDGTDEAFRHDGTATATLTLCADGAIECHVVREGQDVSEILGIVKYEPPVPEAMRGRALGASLDLTDDYNFNNIKANPRLFEAGEEVVATEKVHGTQIQISCAPSALASEAYFGGRVTITSKGLGARGIVLDHTDSENLYARAVAKHGLLDKWLRAAAGMADEAGKPVVLFGEVFGQGVQDLGYNGELEFRAFDVSVGVRDGGRFLPYDEFAALCAEQGILTVPLLYRGPFEREALAACTKGKETVSGRGAHIREGVVVKSAVEAQHPHYGRKIAKSINDAYLLRENGTEFQ